MPDKTEYEKLKKKFGIGDVILNLTNSNKQKKKFTKVKNVIPPKEDYNFAGDLLVLPEYNGYKYLLVIVDLWTDEFDVEPIKNKKSKEVLNAFKRITKRKYLNLPYASLRTDSGTEFKGKFKRFLFNKSILHKVSLPNRHKQNANVERLNRTIGDIIMNYLNEIENNTGKTYKNWIDLLPKLRIELNKYRKKRRKKSKNYKKNIDIKNYDLPELNLNVKPKYKVGDYVHRKLEVPKNDEGKQLYGSFREGDYRYSKSPHKIVKVLPYVGNVPYRYMLEGLSNVSYAEFELLPLQYDEPKFFIQDIKNDKKIKNKKYYLIKWFDYPTVFNTWELATKVKKVVPEIVKEYEKK